MTQRKRGRTAPSHANPRSMRREILVFTEGRITEPDYINHWFRKYRDRTLVTIDSFHATPLTLVEEAKKQRMQDQRDQQRGRGRSRDEYWCIFDRDEHPRLNEAFDLAEENGINVAFSNPCIELWFLLHFKDQTAYIERSNAKQISAQNLKCNKHLSTDALGQLEVNLEFATRRAKNLDNKHHLDGSPPRCNPCSNVWALVERIAAST